MVDIIAIKWYTRAKKEMAESLLRKVRLILLAEYFIVEEYNF